MKPSVEQITEVIYATMPLARRDVVLECAKKIKALYEVKYKPLSELINFKEDCKKIFNFVTEGYGENPVTNIEYRDDCVLVESKSPYKGDIFIRGVFINFDGTLEHYNYFDDKNEKLSLDNFYNRHDNPIENIFELVDFIRNLGYDAKN